MGDYPNLTKIHEKTRRKKKLKDKKPTTVEDLADVVYELHLEWTDWAKWVVKDFATIEAYHPDLKLKPPPPPPDPW